MTHACFPTPSKAVSKSRSDPTAKAALEPTPERVAIMQWTSRMGAVTADALAEHLDRSIASARGQLQVLENARWLSRERPLAEQPALYTATQAGMRTSGLRGLDPCRVSASNAKHLIVCAWVAAALEHCYPDHLILGERELRRDERERGVPLASARLRAAPDRGPLLHRPDLVLWPQAGEHGDELPVAVEVELTVKAPRRLAEICRAWARSRCVAGVLYLATPEVARALHRAIAQTQAGERIALVPLEALPRARRLEKARIEQTVSSAT